MKDKDQKYFNLGEIFFFFFFFPKPNQTENQRIAEHSTSVFCSKTDICWEQPNWQNKAIPATFSSTKLCLGIPYFPFLTSFHTRPTFPGQTFPAKSFPCCYKTHLPWNHTWMCVCNGHQGCSDGSSRGAGQWDGAQTHILSLKSHICLFPLGSAQNQPQLPLLGPCKALLDQFPTGTASPKAAVAWRGAWF